MHCYQDEETRKPAWCSSAFIDIVESSGFPRDGSAELACNYHTRQLWLQRSTEQFAFRGWGFCLFVWLFSSYKGRALCKVPWHLQYLDRMRLLWGSPIMRVLGSFGQLKSKPLVLRLLLSGEVLLPCVSQIKEVLWQKTNCVETNVCLSDGLTLWTDSLWSLTCGKERGAAVLA